MQKMKGFTLIELIITITVLAILATIAVPSFNSLLNRQKLNASARELMSKLVEARTQALTIRQTTGVCVSTVTNCAESLSISSNISKRIFIAQLDKEVTLASGSATQLIFRVEGIPVASSKFALQRQGVARCIEVGVTGDTTYKEGACT
ncbi:prepilin-type N-terminal cleavage/methylation domain-containing protein [Acinetobacter soli]|uniref:pilus assembly FimT family protein n=1 Tax=Acinetobacter soli TaxID=487316 RepID=UPI00287D9E47|nr:GspH/FimT family pseudopilin [Acinetobacter soli]MDS7695384.1 prepilin-type N-terminal cleavage/methylation domain-containing protein [Acinetobacter soli]